MNNDPRTLTTFTKDDHLTCYACHWASATNDEFRQQMLIWGFADCFNIERIGKPMDGNQARRTVVDIAKRQDAKFWYVGDYCAAVGATTQIYKCNYTAFLGDSTDGKGNDRWCASYTPNTIDA